jgi:sulfate adenylyltransferase subunit 1
MEVQHELPVEPFASNRVGGALIVVDPASHRTSGALLVEPLPAPAAEEAW